MSCGAAHTVTDGVSDVFGRICPKDLLMGVRLAQFRCLKL